MSDLTTVITFEDGTPYPMSDIGQLNSLESEPFTGYSGDKIINPRDMEELFYVVNLPVKLTLNGLWKAGTAGHPWLSAVGDPNTQYKNYNKWCALIIGQVNGQAIFVVPYINTMIIQPNGGTFLVRAVINDDDLSDNIQHPTDPMRAHWETIGG